MRSRASSLERSSAETRVSVEVCLDGKGEVEVETGIPFLDHILRTLSFHAKFDLNAKASGDLQHHVVEDLAIVLGNAISSALSDRKGIKRFGHAIVPMDEALAIASVDLVRRPYAKLRLRVSGPYVEGMQKHDVLHFFRSLATNMEATVHLLVLYGEDDHHKVEAATKALGISLRHACRLEEGGGYESVKGLL